MDIRIATAGVAAGVLLLPGPALAAGSITVPASTTRTSDMVVVPGGPIAALPTPTPRATPHGAATAAERARWWVTGGILIMGIAAFLGVAQWQPRRRRRG